MFFSPILIPQNSGEIPNHSINFTARSTHRPNFTFHNTHPENGNKQIRRKLWRAQRIKSLINRKRVWPTRSFYFYSSTGTFLCSLHSKLRDNKSSTAITDSISVVAQFKTRDAALCTLLTHEVTTEFRKRCQVAKWLFWKILLLTFI